MASSSNDPLGRGKGKPQANDRRSQSRARYASRGRDTRRTNDLNRNKSKDPQTRSWVNVASLSAKGYELDYAPPVTVGKKSVVRLSDNARYAGDPKWNNCVVGYFVGKDVPFRITETTVKQMWGSHLSEVLANEDGFYFFIVPDNDFRRKILDEGRITVARVPLVLKQWHCNMELKKELQSSVPVWIRLRNIPFAYWSAPGISEIASAVGRPLYVDPLTEKQKRLSFARVCVEISAKLERCEEIEVWVDDRAFLVKVLYEWRPNSCRKCCAFGHDCLAKENPKQPPVSAGPATVAAKHVTLPVNEEPGDHTNGWKQVMNRKNKQHSGRNDRMVTTPPISALKAKPTEDIPPSPADIVVQNDQNRLEPGTEPSMALVVSNTGNDAIPQSSEEESDEEVSAVSSSSEEEEELVSVENQQEEELVSVENQRVEELEELVSVKNQRDEPRAGRKAPSNQKAIHEDTVVTTSIAVCKEDAMVTPSNVSQKGTKGRKPPKRR